MDEHIPETIETDSVKKEKKTSKRVSKSKVKEKTSVEKGLLLLELAEIKEISDKLFERIEKKIEVLKALEASVDEKINALKKLGQEAVSEKPSDGIEQQKNMVLSLRQKGLEIQEISSILKIPKGEVELILNLHEGTKANDNIGDFEREKKISIVKQQKIKMHEPRSFKSFFKKLLWVVPLCAVGIFVYMYYSYFSPKDYNKTTTRTQISEQNFALQQAPNLEGQQTLNPYEDKAKAIDLIRKKYIVPSDSKEVEEVSKEVLEKKERPIQKSEILKDKKSEQNDGKKTIKVITKSATIRSDHSLNSEPITWVNQGVSFEVKEEFTDDAGKKWYKIITSDGKEGWIADKVVN